MKDPQPKHAGPVAVSVTLAAESRLDESVFGSCPDLAACLARHRIEWQGTERAADGRTTWHFRAPDAESVRIALRHAAVPLDAVTVAGSLDGTGKS